MTNLEQVISELDRQKAAIDNALAALRQVSGPEPKRRGRPPANPAESKSTAAPAKRQVRLTDAGRRRLALSMKKRWAAKRAASEAMTKAAQKTVPKKTVPKKTAVRTDATVSSNKVVLKRTAAKKKRVVKNAAAKKAARKQSVKANTVGKKKTGQKLLPAEAVDEQVAAANV
jgi:hypothetical protein